MLASGSVTETGDLNQWRLPDLVPGQKGHKSYWVFLRGDCQHIVAVRLCIDQSTLKKVNCCKSTGVGGTCPSAP